MLRLSVLGFSLPLLYYCSYCYTLLSLSNVLFYWDFFSLFTPELGLIVCAETGTATGGVLDG